MPVYRPRMEARLVVDAGGESITLPIRVRRASLESNDHLHADELELEVEVADAGIDPRFIRNANVAFWMRDVGLDEHRNLLADVPRFVGVATSVERSASESSNAVSIKAQDYTALFIECKPFPAEGVPRYTDTLVEAWKRVCDHTGVFDAATGAVASTVSRLKSSIEFRGAANPGTVIGRAAPARLAGAGTIPVKQGGDAWAAWSDAVGMCGLLSFIELDKCIVTTAADHFKNASAGAPQALWGSNVLSFRETSHGRLGAKGVWLVSVNQTTGEVLEAPYPPPDDPRIQAHRATAAKKKAGPTELKAEAYEVLSYDDVSDPKILHELARLIWEQRSRQELEGSLETAEMFFGSDRGAQVDLLGLRSGDSLVVTLDPKIQTGAFSTMSLAERIGYLADRGYSLDIARLIATTLKQKMTWGMDFKVKKVRTMLETHDSSGRFRVSIDYWNRIHVTT